MGPSPSPSPPPPQGLEREPQTPQTPQACYDSLLVRYCRDGPRPLSKAGGRPQAALNGRRTALGRSPWPADDSRPLSKAGRRPLAAIRSRRTTPRPLSTAGGRPRGRSSRSSCSSLQASQDLCSKMRQEIAFILSLIHQCGNYTSLMAEAQCS